jgi:phosphatidate cytidylyltransferase
MTRVLSGMVLILVTVGVVGWAPRWGIFLALVALSSLALNEFLELAEKCNLHPLRWASYLYSLWLLGEQLFFPQQNTPAAFIIFVLVVLGLSLRRPERFAALASSSGATILGTVYISGFLSLLLAWQNPASDRAIFYHSPFESRAAIFFLLTVVWAGDTGAFYVGRGIGKHKLAPRISPGKTVEGLIGGLVASMASALVFHRFWLKGLSVAGILGLAVAIGLAGVLGDLVESAMKRGAGVKDSSAIIPGHGGVLDRIDSLLFAIPVMYYYPSVIAFLKSVIKLV